MANADLILIPVIILSLFIGVVLLLDYLSGKDYDSEWKLADSSFQFR